MTDQNVSSIAIKTLLEGNNKRLLDLVPKGISPKVYIELIKTQILGTDRQGNHRSDEDLLYFLYVANRTGLDPITKQIYAVYRWDNRLGAEKMTVQTGIDGMRLVAQRNGHYAGQDDVIYLPTDEATKYPIKATVTVYKIIESQRVGFTATARWNEYVQKDKSGQATTMWDTKPYLMLGKCAEALALRKAFPNELSGVYSEDEMAQVNNPISELPKPTTRTSGKQPQVIHGKPEEQNALTAPIGTPETAQLDKTQNLPLPYKKEQQEIKQVVPDLGAMRQALADTEAKARETKTQKAIDK